MFKFLAASLLLLISLTLKSQETILPDTLFLRSGKIVYGRLQSDRNDDFIKITVNDKLQLFSSTDIRRIGSSLTEEFKDFYWGIKTGATLADAAGSDSKDLASNPGLTAGLFTTYRINRNLTLQAELLYTPKGYQTAEDFPYLYYTLPIDCEYNFTAIEIPVLLKWALPEKQNIKSSLFAGPVAGFYN